MTDKGRWLASLRKELIQLVLFFASCDAQNQMILMRVSQVASATAAPVDTSKTEPTELRVCLHVSWVFQNALCSKILLQARFLKAGRSAPIVMQGFHQFANRSLCYKDDDCAVQEAVLKAVRGPRHRVNCAIATAKSQRDPIFGLDALAECPSVRGEILIPRTAWSDKSAYEVAAKKLAELFRNNFKPYEGSVSAEVRQVAVSA